MDNIISFCGFAIEVRLSPIARRLILKVKGDRSGFAVTLPRRTSIAAAEKFIKQNEGWLRANSRYLVTRRKFTDGVSFSFLGETVTLHHSPASRRGVWREENDIFVSGDEEYIHRRTKDFFKKEFLTHLKIKVAKYNESNSKKVQRITIRENTSRWGCCSSNCTLSFNFYLCYAPESIVDYVIVHELSHLEEMNHSPAFWKRVSAFYPDYKKARTWLKREGKNLYQFAD